MPRTATSNDLARAAATTAALLIPTPSARHALSALAIAVLSACASTTTAPAPAPVAGEATKTAAVAPAPAPESKATPAVATTTTPPAASATTPAASATTPAASATPAVVGAKPSGGALFADLTAPGERTPAMRPEAAARSKAGSIVPGEVNVYTFKPAERFVAVDPMTTSIAQVLADLGADAAEWYQHVQTLSNPWFEGRAPGTDGIERAAGYCAFWMAKAGLEPAFAEGTQANPDDPWRQPFDLPTQRLRTVENPGDEEAIAKAGPTVTHNVGGILRGKGDLAGEWLVIGAHYDHVGYGAYGADPRNRGTVHPGADDNASGTSGMLVMARRLAEAYAGAGDDADLRSVLFLAFSAEEMGLNGSRAFVKSPSIPADKVDVMLNMDMIGRIRQDRLVVGGVESAKGFRAALDPMFRESGLEIFADPNGRGPSDHASFYGVGIPVLFFFSGVHDVYHQPGDQGYSVDPRGVPAVLDLVERIALWRAGDATRLEFARPGEGAAGSAQAAGGGEPRGQDRGYAGVRLGIQPGMGEEGESGIRVESVSAGTSAADAGIQAGDVLLSWDGVSLDDIAAMMTKLRSSKPGEVARMRVLRGDEILEIDVKLKASNAPRRPQDD